MVISKLVGGRRVGALKYQGEWDTQESEDFNLIRTHAASSIDSNLSNRMDLVLESDDGITALLGSLDERQY